MAFTAGRGWTPDEYLTRERRAKFKSEYLCGGIYAMIGGTPLHAKIAANVIASLVLALKGSTCNVYSSNLRIASAHAQLIAYPDASVVCGSPEFHDDKKDVVTNPVVIIEVLSDSTEAYDRGKKFTYYRTIEALQDYVLISHHEAAIDIYSREPSGSWRIQTITGTEGFVEIISIQCRLALADVYEGAGF